MTYQYNVSRSQASALALATGLVLGAHPAYAQSGSYQGSGVVVEGSATITEGATTTDITVESTSAVIDWTPDDNAGGGDILFQPSGTTATFTNGTGITEYAVLNRILPADINRRIVFDGTTISLIQDGMTSTPGGAIWFYTPGGIVIGSNAVFDVGSLGLTTAAPATDGMGNFFAGDTVTFQQSQTSSSITIDQGAQISALEEGSYVAVWSPVVVHRGDIAVNGQAALVAAESGTMTFSPDGLFDIQVDIGTAAPVSLENTGTIGGPSSEGVGDHRVYMVAVAKNTATTMVIRGGSSLGFDVAQSASMDGDTVVLSAGYNITNGEIEDEAVSDANLNFNGSDFGNGTDLLFTSDVVARASNSLSLTVNAVNAAFLGNARFEALNMIFSADNGAMLTVDGDLDMLAIPARQGFDAGTSDLRVRSGSSVMVGGNLTVASLGDVDGDGNGIGFSGQAKLQIRGAGSTLDVMGDLVLRSLVDRTGFTDGASANSNLTQLFIDTGGAANVGGVTRIRSDAIAGLGGNATGGNAQLFINTGGQLTTGELNMTANAFGGDDNGAGGGSATGGFISAQVLGTGSALTVLNSNTIADTFAGGLDFLSNQAFGGQGINGAGGDATSRNIVITIAPGATASLPFDTLNPLRIVNSAVGGDTSANDSRGGIASGGIDIIDIDGATVDLGNLSYTSSIRGGSALPGAERTTGGGAFNGTFDLQIDNSTVDVGFDQILLETIGGNGSGDGGGGGGNAEGGNVTMNVVNSTLNIANDFVVQGLARGGDGQFGAFARSRPFAPFLFNSTVNVGGDFAIDMTAQGGNGIGSQAVEDMGFATDGGSAQTSFIGFQLRGSQVNAAGEVRLGSNAIGGDSQTGNAGSAVASETFVGIFGNSTVDATAFRVFSRAFGGSVLDPMAMGNGGSAQTGRATVSYDGNINGTLVAFTGDVSSETVAEGGDAGALGGNGGSGFASTAELRQFQPGDVTVGGNVELTTRGIGGAAPMGQGGSGGSGFLNINTAQNGSVSITGDVFFDSRAEGGAGQNGGSAGSNTLRVGGNGETLVGGSIFATGRTIGGDALDSENPGNGGQAFGGTFDLTSSSFSGIGATTTVGGNVTVDFEDRGGRGGNSTVAGEDGGRGGDAFGSRVTIDSTGQIGGVDIAGDINADVRHFGGQGGSGDNGGDGGNVFMGEVDFGVRANSAVGQVNEFRFGNANFTFTGIGGDGGEATNGTGGNGGDAVEGYVEINNTNGLLQGSNFLAIVLATGGSGGAGNVQGDGGNASSPFLDVDFSSFNGVQGVTDLASLLIQSNVTGGTGANEGLATVAEFADFEFDDAQVTIGDFTIIEQGETGNADLRTLEIENSTLDIGNFAIATGANLTFEIDIDSTVNVDTLDITAASILLDNGFDPANPGQINAEQSIRLTSTLGSVEPGINLVTDGLFEVNSAEDIILGDVNAESITLNAPGGLLQTGTLSAPNGAINLVSFGSIDLAGITANSIDARSLGGDVTSGAVINITGDLNLLAAGIIALGDVTAQSIGTQSDGTTIINGIWQAQQIDITAPDMQFGVDGLLDAGTDGAITIRSSNINGILVDEEDTEGTGAFLIDPATFALFSANEVFIVGSAQNANGPDIRIGTLDISVNPTVSSLTFTANGEINVFGALTGPADLTFVAPLVTLNTDTGLIDVGGNRVSIFADVLAAAEGSVLDQIDDTLTPEDLQELFNTPAVTERADGVLIAGTLELNVIEAALIQNTGTEELPAGFVIADGANLILGSEEQTGPLVILNGQIANGEVLTGDDAATAILDAIDNPEFFAEGSQINMCAFSGCEGVAVDDGAGEVTSTVSAAVNGATGAATSGASGSTGTSGSGSGSSSGGDSGSDSGGDSGGDDGGGEDSSASSGAGAGAGAGTGGSSSGGEVTVDNVDDGGGGNDDFAIDEGSSDSGGDSSGDSGSDSGSDDGGSDDGGSDDGESSSEESESESEESESEESEEEESEEESSEEEEEDSEGPATGPINPPPSIINTNGLEQRGPINDPISGSGNPALLNPDIDLPPVSPSGDQ